MHYVLVVSDDEEDNDLLTQAFYAQPGKIPVKCITAGITALHFINRTLPTEFPFLVVIDQRLPDIDSLSLLEKLKRSNHSRLIPVAIMSGFASQQVIRDYYMAGANCFYKKPLDNPEWNHMADCLLTLFHSKY